MITVLNTKDGLLYAFCEWNIVNSKGQFEDWGQYLYINDLWIHKDYRRKQTLQKIIDLINKHYFTANVMIVYWRREKYHDRMSGYSIERLAKKGDIHEQRQDSQCASISAVTAIA